MAAKVEQRLRQAVSDLRKELAAVPIPDPPTTPWRRGRILGPAVAVAAGLVVVLLVMPGGVIDSDLAVTSQSQTVDTALSSPTLRTAPSTTPPTTTARVTTTTSLAVKLPAQGPIFGEETGVLLLLDDGLDGLIAVDPDLRLAGRSLVEGQRPGDEQYSMILVGDKLVVGWSEPHAVDVATRQAISLGMATIFVPAAEPNRVWMIDSGARIGSEELQVWQVDVSSGVALQDPVPLAADGDVQIGIQGGLALQTDTGLNLWTMETGRTIPLESPAPGFVHDVFEDELVWCSGDCSKLAVTNTSTVETQDYQPPAGYETFWVASRISPSGRYLAALVGLKGTPEGIGIWILDRDTGDTNVVSDPETSVFRLAWAPENDQLFATSWSYGEDRTVVWRYQITDQEFAAVVLPFGGALNPVVIERSAGGAYFDSELVDITRCPIPRTGSGQASSCTFGY